jgi:hypothetical protein
MSGLYQFAVSRDGERKTYVAGWIRVMRFRKQIDESVKKTGRVKPGCGRMHRSIQPMLESGAELYRAVVEAIEVAVTGDRLTIVPHGVLH